MLFRIFVVIIVSIVLTLSFFAKSEDMMFWSKYHGEEVPKDFRKKLYKKDLIFGAICFIGFLVYFVFLTT